MILRSADLIELLQELFLLPAEFLRCLDNHAHVEVSLAIAVQVRYTLSAEPVKEALASFLV